MGHLADIAVGISAISFRALGGDDRPLIESACVRSLVRSLCTRLLQRGSLRVLSASAGNVRPRLYGIV